MNHKLLFKMPYLLLYDLCEEFGIKKSNSKEAMIKEAVKLVENSDEKVAAVFSKFKEMALDHELKEIAKAIGAQKYGLPEDKDELFDIISEKIGYKTPTRKIKNDKAEVETKIIVKEEELRAVRVELESC